MRTTLKSAAKRIFEWLIAQPVFRAIGLGILGAVRSIQALTRRRRLVVYYYAPVFERKAHALADLLRRRGFSTEVVNTLSYLTRIRLKSSPDLWIGFWNYVPRSVLPKNYIAINAEPLSITTSRHEISEILDIMKKAKAVWDYSRTNTEAIARAGVTASFVPFGYAPYYEEIFRRNTEGKNLQSDIDVLFFGVLSDRRRRVVDDLNQRSMKVCVLDRNNAVFGEKLDELLARSKIILGIHYYDEARGQIADLARIDHLLSNQLFVLHERPSTLGRNDDFEDHVATCEYEDIPQKCAYFLSNPAERIRSAKVAHEWLKSRYAIDDFIPYDEVRRWVESC